MARRTSPVPRTGVCLIAGMALGLAACGQTTSPGSSGVGSAPIAAPVSAPADSQPAEPSDAPVQIAQAKAAGKTGANSAVAAGKPGFRFADDAGGKLLASTLVPARTSTPLAYVVAPRPLRPLPLERMGVDGAWLVPIDPLEPRGLMPPAAEGKSRPLVDVPVLAMDVDLPRPALPAFPVTARSYADSLDAGGLPPLAPLPRPASVPPSPASDPTADAALGVLLAGASAGRATPAPPITLEIPDPFIPIRRMEMRAFPPETAPAFAPTTAPRPTLPVEAPAKRPFAQ